MKGWSPVRFHPHLKTPPHLLKGNVCIRGMSLNHRDPLG